MIEKSNINCVSISRSVIRQKPSETIQTNNNISVLKSNIDKKRFSIIKKSRNSKNTLNDNENISFLKPFMMTQSTIFTNEKLNELKFLKTSTTEENKEEKTKKKLSKHKFECFRLILNKIVYSPNKNKKKEKEVVIRPVKKMIEEWKKVKKSNSEYTSGCLSLPLVTQIISDINK